MNLTKYANKIIFGIFVIMAFIGASIFHDYNVSADEVIERFHSQVMLSKVMETFGMKVKRDKMFQTIIDENPAFPQPWSDIRNKPKYFEYLSDINKFPHKYYGTAIHIIPAIYEYVFIDYLSSKQIYLFRHLYTFLIYFISLICFYFICLHIFKSKFLSILGVIMIFLYPRFFAESFYNNKDIMFSSLLLIAFFSSTKFLAFKSNKYAILTGFLIALASNTRFFALFLLACLFVIMLLEFWKKRLDENFLPYIVLLVSFVISFYILTPASWSNLFLFICEYVNKFYGYDDWNNRVLFMGELILKTDLPRYYFIVWLIISLPIIYIILFAFGVRLSIKSLENIHSKKFTEIVNLVLENKIMVLVFVIFFAPFTATIIQKGLLYHAWRHLYFTFPFFVIIAVFGISYFNGKLSKTVVILLIAISLVLQTSWIIKNHPYQALYLNSLGRTYGSKFCKDMWGLSDLLMLEYMLHAFPQEEIFQVAANLTPLYTIMLDEKDQKKINHNFQNPEFFVFNYGTVNTNNISLENSGWREIASISIDGYKINALLQRVDKKEMPDE